MDSTDFIYIKTPKEQLREWLEAACNVYRNSYYDQVLENDTPYDIDSLIDAYKDKGRELLGKDVGLYLFHKTLQQVCKKTIESVEMESSDEEDYPDCDNEY
jgi:hypothetical protein